MPKELTKEDILKKQYSELVKLNQRIKNIASCYYIHKDGVIYLKALVPFTEVLIKLRYPEKIESFLGCMILPNEFFQFTKSAKKTKLTFEEDDVEGTKKFIFGQNDDKELTYILNIVNGADLESFESNRFVQEQIVNKMYKRYFNITNEDYIQCNDQDFVYQIMPMDLEQMLKEKKAMFLDFKGAHLTITKELFLDAKKDDVISLSRKSYQKVENKLCRMFYMIEHNTDLYTSYTIFNVLQQIK